jgi:5-methylcytosine-specific restriction endonuclease McrA
MTRLPPRRPRLSLDPESYRQLHQQVLERDGWRCQHCGGLTDLQIHHVGSRSSLGDDADQNLITLCVGCHEDVHLAKPIRVLNRQGK